MIFLLACNNFLIKYSRSRIRELADVASVETINDCKNNKIPIQTIEIDGILLASSLRRILSCLEMSMQSNSRLKWSMVSLKPSPSSLFLLPGNLKAKTFISSSRNVLISKDYVIARSKRG